jgi:hypothetical protein
MCAQLGLEVRCKRPKNTRRKTGINDFINDYNLSCLGHLQSSLSRPSDWKTTTCRCTSMLIQNMASVVVFELHRTCSCSLSGCIGHGIPLVKKEKTI